MFGKEFTPEEDEKIMEMRRQGFTHAQIAVELGRKESSVKLHWQHIQKRGGRKPKFRQYTPEEDSLILELRRQGLEWKDVASHFPGRSTTSIANRGKRLVKKAVLEGSSDEQVVGSNSGVRDIPARLLPKTYWRKCHTCGKLTPFFRCEKCRGKWKTKHSVSEDAGDNDEQLESYDVAVAWDL